MKDLFSLTEEEFDKVTPRQIHRYLIEQGGYTEKEIKAWINRALKRMMRKK